MPTTSYSECAGASDANRTSQSLIVRAKERDSAAWERLVTLYSPLVYYWCQQAGLQQSDLQDVFQDVFYTIARSIERYRPIENGTFRGWLRTLTRNKLNDHFRKLGREPLGIGGSEAMDFFSHLPSAAERLSTVDGVKMQSSNSLPAERTIVHAMLSDVLAIVRGSFSEQTWKAFWMVVIDGREANDVGQELGMRPGAVRVAKSRVLKRLRLELCDFNE